MDANTGGKTRAESPCAAKIADHPRIPMRAIAHCHQKTIISTAARFLLNSQRLRIADDCRMGGLVIQSLTISKSLMVLCAVAASVLVSSCATPEATDVAGRWRPVNRFAEVPQAIPLQQAYIYQASPADGTLKTMLSRWAKDARLTLAYLHPNDYTLHAPVAQIRTGSLEDAASTLSAAYADQGVRVVIERPRIIVSQAAVPASDVAPTARLGE